MSDTPTPRTDAILSLLPGGQTCDPQLVADELRPKIAELERELDFSEKAGRQIWQANERLEAELATAQDGWTDEICKAQADMRRAETMLNDEREHRLEAQADYRCLAELLDGHDATECRANLVKLKETLRRESMLAAERTALLHDEMGKSADLQDELTAERALADRLAVELEIAEGDYRNLAKNCTRLGDSARAEMRSMASDFAEALAAWKEARK